jgi:hypothetical protein
MRIVLEDAELRADPTVNEQQFTFLHFYRAAEPAFPTGERRCRIGVKSEKAGPSCAQSLSELLRHRRPNAVS